MKNFLFLLFFAVVVNAQTHRFIYEMKFKPDSTKADYHTENMVLDVNPKEVKFYPYAYAENDSLNKTRDYHNIMWDDALPALKRSRGTGENFNYILSSDFFVLKTDDKMDWVLSQETKTEYQYLLQKATTHFGGRKWIAWFCKDINISEGPYKFRGLPGLIFQIEDSNKNFKFNLLKSLKFPKTYDTSEFVETYGGQKPIPVTKKILNSKFLEQYRDPMRDTREAFKNNNNPENTFWYMGTQIKSLDQFKDFTKIAQDRMRRENNPIELDKAIHYPVK